MNKRQGVSEFAGTAYIGTNIEPLPESCQKRSRMGDELQQVGAYADVNPYYRTVEDIEVVQSHEQEDPEFKSRDWWWTHQRIGFLNGKQGLKALMLVVPFAWILLLWLGGPGLMIWGLDEFEPLRKLPALLVAAFVLVFSFGWIAFAIWATPYTTNWLMSTGIGFFLKPFEKSLNNRLDNAMDDGYSEFNRVTGQVRLGLGRSRIFEAPFIEFDAYVERIIQHGGIFYRLMLVHRYTQKTFNKTSLSNIEAQKNEVLALWDMLQRFMDVSEPLPDVPRFEPFRHLDPITLESDKKTGRNPRYWRDLDLASWRQNDGAELLKKQRNFPWGQRQCRLTPKLGKVSMAEYREKRPSTAWPI
ncbi:hypothetical protein [Marinobacter sp. F4206]|uniref:hypothetical protein n=1 Tax=Marinobacter sp. F4206 TaxID=2861777 RepID=UPI001C5D9490|nr:hypothetical protein [Marinobacter sp. F4206]MBW4936087.1 hypothetical protein [Marinobacter sp. F4206]